MSISNPRAENPCKKFIDYNGEKGLFFFYDKDKEEKVNIPVPIYFIVLDELSTISGYNKKHDCGIYSNEVHRTADELLKVKTFKGGEEIVGYYSEIKDSVIALGGKYTKSVYALLIGGDGTTEMVNFKFRGASFSGWLDKKINTDKFIIGITGFTEEKNGNITYQVPVFKGFNMKADLRERAIAADEVLQSYLEEYASHAPVKETETATPSNPLTDNQGKWRKGDNFAPTGGFKDPEGNQGSPGAGYSAKEAIVAKSKSQAELDRQEFELMAAQGGSDNMDDLPF